MHTECSLRFFYSLYVLLFFTTTYPGIRRSSLPPHFFACAAFIWWREMKNREKYCRVTPECLLCAFKNQPQEKQQQKRNSLANSIIFLGMNSLLLQRSSNCSTTRKRGRDKIWFTAAANRQMNHFNIRNGIENKLYLWSPWLLNRMNNDREYTWVHIITVSYLIWTSPESI